MNYVNSSNDFNITDLKEIESKCVAWRCMLQIEFFNLDPQPVAVGIFLLLYERAG